MSTAVAKRDRVKHLEQQYGKPIADIIDEIKRRENLPVRLIAKRLGVGEATIYRHQRKEA